MQQNSTNSFAEDELLDHILTLRKFARRFYSSPNDIDDLVQETSTKAIANSEKFDGQRWRIAASAQSGQPMRSGMPLPIRKTGDCHVTRRSTSMTSSMKEHSYRRNKPFLWDASS